MPKVPHEVIAEQYQLKATFFSNSLEKDGYVGLFEFAKFNLKKLDGVLDWSSYADFKISDDSFRSLQRDGLSLTQHLCHPNALISNPKYLTYFRCIAAISQKGLKTLSGVSAVDRLEAGVADMTPRQALLLAKTINENLNAIYSISLPHEEKLKGLMYATAGTTLDGSWRNNIGAEGERVIRTLFLKELLENSELLKVTDKDGVDYGADLIDSSWLDEKTASLSSAVTTNGAVVLFGSEPDITLLNKDSKTVGGIEIKAGIDPAGALERLGAMMKSFENIRSASSEAETILVASCITDEVDQRLRSMRGVRTFILTDVIQNNGSQGTRLMNIMRASIGLTASYY